MPAALFVPENDENKPQPKVGASALKRQPVLVLSCYGAASYSLTAVLTAVAP